LAREEDVLSLVEVYARLAKGNVRDELGSAIVTMKKEKR
jgi:hypothetical protein